MDVMCLKLTTFLTRFFRLHVVMIPSYKTPVEVLRMALHARDSRDLGTLGRQFYRRLKIWQLGNLPKKTTWKAHGAWNQVVMK